MYLCGNERLLTGHKRFSQYKIKSPVGREVMMFKSSLTGVLKLNTGITFIYSVLIIGPDAGYFFSTLNSQSHAARCTPQEIHDQQFRIDRSN